MSDTTKGEHKLPSDSLLCRCHQRWRSAEDEIQILQSDLGHLQQDCAQSELETASMTVKILAAQQQTKDYKDAVELMDSSINRLKNMLTAQDAILADGQSLIYQSINQGSQTGLCVAPLYSNPYSPWVGV